MIARKTAVSGRYHEVGERQQKRMSNDREHGTRGRKPPPEPPPPPDDDTWITISCRILREHIGMVTEAAEIDGASSQAAWLRSVALPIASKKTGRNYDHSVYHERGQRSMLRDKTLELGLTPGQAARILEAVVSQGAVHDATELETAVAHQSGEYETPRPMKAAPKRRPPPKPKR
jgi:hypothetical protein